MNGLTTTAKLEVVLEIMNLTAELLSGLLVALKAINIANWGGIERCTDT